MWGLILNEGHHTERTCKVLHNPLLRPHFLSDGANVITVMYFVNPRRIAHHMQISWGFLTTLEMGTHDSTIYLYSRFQAFLHAFHSTVNVAASYVWSARWLSIVSKDFSVFGQSLSWSEWSTTRCFFRWRPQNYWARCWCSPFSQ